MPLTQVDDGYYEEQQQQKQQKRTRIMTPARQAALQKARQAKQKKALERQQQLQQSSTHQNTNSDYTEQQLLRSMIEEDHTYNDFEDNYQQPQQYHTQSYQQPQSRTYTEEQVRGFYEKMERKRQIEALEKEKERQNLQKIQKERMEYEKMIARDVNGYLTELGGARVSNPRELAHLERSKPAQDLMQNNRRFNIQNQEPSTSFFDDLF